MHSWSKASIAFTAVKVVALPHFTSSLSVWHLLLMCLGFVHLMHSCRGPSICRGLTSCPWSGSVPCCSFP